MPEIGYNDGSYLTQKGNDLIAKLMASGEGLQFTRVSVGDGSWYEPISIRQVKLWTA